MEKLKKCFNCGCLPVYYSLPKEYFKHIIKHNEDICPYRYETHQHSKEAAIKDMNSWLKNKANE